MINIDLGGMKHSRIINGKWRVMDIRKGSDYLYNINSGKSIPLKDNSVDNYFLSMTLEHVEPSLTVFVLKEMRRTLKQGGLIRIIVPDASIAINWFVNDKEKLKQHGNPSKPDFYPDTYGSRLFSWFYTPDRGKMSGHKNLFDKETINWYIVKSGFNNIRFMEYGKHSPIFKGKDYKRYMEYSIYVEATK